MTNEGSAELRAADRRPAALTVSEVASLFGLSEEAVLKLASRRHAPVRQEFLSIAELADRWRCSRGTVYNPLRAAGGQVLDFAARGKKGKKAVPASTVVEIENRYTRRVR
jgi:hypothetical protein